ncbi:MAG: uroporphyrinogen-III C-methyltransferase [Candidatus Glassbacteria bacterium]|nr:uroporphyrinogen-III C-methyltransferase [Candidatus Glassbacteria bacterium]
MTEKKGKIYLVGAGPGDPELITLKGLRAVERADVLVYDYLAPEVLLQYARPGCEKIYVGKKAGRHTMPQEEINRLVVGRAAAGAMVVRLKGGDPFVFGRGGEEALEAAAAGVEFEVVPGVTAGVAVPAYAGIPVSQRGMASAVAFITGHEDPGKEQSDIDWEQLAKFPGTLVFYMGLGRLGSIAQELTSHGLDPAAEVAVIHRGTTERQRAVTGSLEDIGRKVRQAGLKAPAIIVVGKVVGLRERLSWFESRPLFGRTVIVTRAREQASEFSRILDGYGARVIEMPTIRISDSPEPEKVAWAIDRLDRYDWLIFTSVNGVERFFHYLRASGRDVRAIGQQALLCAIGPVTRAALEASGLRVDLVPGSYVAESVVEALKSRGDLKGKRVLLPRAAVARQVIPEALRALGAEVDEVAVYSTGIETPENLDRVVEELTEGRVDVVTFTSSSTVENFVRLVGEPVAAGLGGKTLVASIGPVTAEIAAQHGLRTDIMPEDYTVEGLAAAVRDHFTSGKGL